MSRKLDLLLVSLYGKEGFERVFKVSGRWAIGLWMYQSLDAIDGKQARRTGTSGPLGEMFDHGVSPPLGVSVCR